MALSESISGVVWCGVEGGGSDGWWLLFLMLWMLKRDRGCRVDEGSEPTLDLGRAKEILIAQEGEMSVSL